MLKKERISTFGDIAIKRRLKNKFLANVKEAMDWRRFNSIF